MLVHVPGAGDDEELWCPRGFEAGDLTTFFRAVVTGRNGSCDDDDDDDMEEEEEEDNNNNGSTMYITSGGLANLSAEVAEQVRDHTTFERMMHAYVARKHARGHHMGYGVASSKLPPRMRMLVDPPDIALLLGVRLGHGFDAVEVVSNATTTMSVASGGAVGSTVVFLLQQEEDVKRVVEASASVSAGASVHIRIAHAPWHKRRGRQPLCTAFGDVHAWYLDCRRRGGIFAVACDRPRCEHAVACSVKFDSRTRQRVAGYGSAKGVGVDCPCTREPCVGWRGRRRRVVFLRVASAELGCAQERVRERSEEFFCKVVCRICM